MAFPSRLLADHEEIVFDLKPHWIALLPAAAWGVLVIAGLIVASALAGRADDPMPFRVAVVVIALIALLVLSVAPALRWYFTNFVLTSDRLITRSGIIAKRSKEIPLERINDVAFTQSVWERALGAGDLLVESAGERGQTVIANVRHPEQVQLTIYEATEANSNRMMGARSEGRPDIAEQISALARLKEQGVLSEAEFEAKKRELLDRM